jgi:16S rRNA (cytidine1402-2'-O)-methyltransferase
MSGSIDAPPSGIASPTPTLRGALHLVPNTLDLGIPAAPTPLGDVLPMATIRTAARLTHWVVENAKSARAFLKRVHEVCPLAVPLQAQHIVVLPARDKGATGGSVGSRRSTPASDLLEPLRRGHDLGVLSEAGMPGVADPGAELVAAAHDEGFVVRALVGPSALLLALAASGLNGQSFAFVGYLPVAAAARTARIRELEALSRRTGQTQMFIETPYRNMQLLDALLATLAGGTRLALAHGLTTPLGWSRTHTVADWQRHRPSLQADVPSVFAVLAAHG